jgi:son of sevenless-like protein
LNNFNTFNSIIAGLNVRAVTRLERTSFTLIAPDRARAFQSFADIISPEGGFKMFREQLRNTTLPAIPFLGQFLSDLTLIEDGNKDTLNGLINFQKREMTMEIISDLQKYQSKPYPFPRLEPLFTYLIELPHIDSQRLYPMSLYYEPRDPVTPKSKCPWLISRVLTAR